jgi:uncharacterized protein
VDSLSDKLKMLGVHRGTQDLKPSQPRTTFPVEDVLPGRFIQTTAGSVYLVEEKYNFQHLHGTTSLEFNGSLKIIAEWAGYPEIAEHNEGAIVFLDTETSGLAGGTGTFAFMVGLGTYHEDRFPYRAILHGRSIR